MRRIQLQNLPFLMSNNVKKKLADTLKRNPSPGLNKTGTFLIKYLFTILSFMEPQLFSHTMRQDPAGNVASCCYLFWK